jgi:hypothetical protein
MPSQVAIPEEWPGVVVDIYGPVRVSCTYANAGGMDDRGYVLLRSPNTLTYCMSSGAVVGCLSAWLMAWEQACPQLPETASAPARPDYRDRVTSAATLEGHPNPRLVKFFDSNRSPTGTPHVLVRTGPVSARVYDQAGMLAFVEGWVAAHEAADEAFERPPRASLQALRQRARHEARNPYRKLGELGMGRPRPPERTQRPGWRSERTAEVRSIGGR